ncbi:MAG: hypothetical protein JW809_15185 [Pirellulales bacterium]|nr:hypothetical protein [Pirellulales bacterium]
MAHELAKLMLEHADTFLERSEAVKTALYLGMPLDEIEGYLDWLESVRGLGSAPAAEPSPKPLARKPGESTPRPSAPSLRPFGCTPPFPRPTG